MIHPVRDFSIVLALAIAMQSIEYYGWLAGPEGKLTDLLISAKRSQSAASPIVLVEVDDEAYEKCFQETSPMNPQALAALVEQVANGAAPRVIGVDILTDSKLHADEYQAMAAEFRRLPSKIVWIAGSERAEYKVPAFFPWLFGRAKDEFEVKATPVLGFSPGELEEQSYIAWGVPVYPRDEDSGVRRFPREIQLSADPGNSVRHETRPSWARMIAEEYRTSRGKGRSNAGDEVLISYATPAPRPYNMLELFTCPAKGKVERIESKWAEFRKQAQNNIVLIGGTFRSSGDFHETPAGRKPGLEINAYSVQAEIDGSGINEAARPVSFAFDLVVGILLVLLHSKIEHANWALPRFPKLHASIENNETRWTLVASAILVTVSAGLTLVLFGVGYLLSFLGVALGVMLHQIVDMFMKGDHKHHH